MLPAAAVAAGKVLSKPPSSSRSFHATSHGRSPTPPQPHLVQANVYQRPSHHLVSVKLLTAKHNSLPEGFPLVSLQVVGGTQRWQLASVLEVFVHWEEGPGLDRGRSAVEQGWVAGW